MTDNYPQFITKFCMFLDYQCLHYSGWLLLANINMAGPGMEWGCHLSSSSASLIADIHHQPEHHLYQCIRLPSSCHCHHNVYPSFSENLCWVKGKSFCTVDRSERPSIVQSPFAKGMINPIVCVNILQRFPIFQISNHNNHSGNKLFSSGTSPSY